MLSAASLPKGKQVDGERGYETQGDNDRSPVPCGLDRETTKDFYRSWPRRGDRIEHCCPKGDIEDPRSRSELVDSLFPAQDRNRSHQPGGQWCAHLLRISVKEDGEADARDSQARAEAQRD